MNSLRPPAPQDSEFPTAVEQRVLTITREVLAELGAQHAISNLTPSASLERDLGLGSLERVELISRLESDFAVSLPDQVAAAAETLKDLVVGLLQPGLKTPAVARALHSAPSAKSEQPRRETWGAADTATTLTEALIRHCEIAPERPHVFLYEDDKEDQTPQTITYGDLLREATTVARGLEARGLEHGRSVALMLLTSEDFFSCFFGILLSGGVPVPIYPPFRADQIEEYARRQSGILRNAEAQFLITFRRAEILGRLLRPGVPSLEGVLTPENFRRSKGNDSPREAEDPTQAVRRARAFAFLNPSRTGLIQYTSGSTGDPKGVVLSHSNLLANIWASGAAMEVCPTDVGVSWLPLYHDMGLIASWLLCLCYGIPIAILSPLAFLRRPERWLWAIHRHRATLSPGPNFAYELCAGKISDAALEGLDLSCWRSAYNGAEPVSPDTIDRFAQRFAPYGFRRETMMPVYGLAEATVGLCLPPVGRRPRVDTIRRERLENEGLAEPIPDGDQTDGAAKAASPLRFVSVGRPVKEHEVKIVDEKGQPVGERRQGRLLFRGPSTTSGYFRNPQATAACLHDGWWDSGDYAYRAEGEIYITGRTKDVIIKGGRNIYPHEIEEVTAQVSSVRRGCVVAFGFTDARRGTEKLVVIAESREKGGQAEERIRSEIIEKVSAAVGMPPDTVVLVPPKTIPKTSSGKLRRDATRKLFETGKLQGRRTPAWVQLAKLSGRAAGSSLRRRIRTLGRVGFAAYVGLVMAATMLPGWVLVLLIPSRKVTLRLSQGWARLFLRLVGCPLQVAGMEHLKSASPCVMVANHASYLDPVVILAALPGDVRMVAKQEAYSWPIIGTILRKSGHITVDRRNTSQSIEDSDRIQNPLREGSSVLIFPEGTFTPAKGVRPFKLGAFKAAVETSLPVLPVSISGTRHILRDRSWLPRRGPIQVTIRPPLQPTENHWREVVRLRDAARKEIVRHCDEEALDLLVAGLPGID